MADYRIELGIGLKNGDLADIKNKIESLENEPIKLKIDAETTELTNTIKEALSALSKGAKGSLVIDTKKIEDSLDKLSATITSIKDSLGTFDSKSGMKDLLSSINQIATALGKAENESDSLVRSLSALSKKDLSINFGVKLGGSNSVANNIEYGNKVRNEIVPKLRQQVEALLKEYNRQAKTSVSEQQSFMDLITGTKFATGDLFQGLISGSKDGLFARMENGRKPKEQMTAYKEFIDIYQQAAKLKGIDLSSALSGFSETPSELIKSAQDIQTGVKQTEDGFEKLKNILGSSIDGEGLSVQLDSIVADLKEIKDAIQSLSQNDAIDSLTQSFNRLSETLDRLMTNAKLVQDVLGSISVGDNIGVGDGLESEAKQARESVEEIRHAGEEITRIYDKISRDTSLVRDGADFQDAFEKTNQAAQEAQRHFQELLADEKAIVSVTEQFDGSNMLQSFVVNVQRATGEVETLRYAVDKLGDEDGEIFKYQGGSVSDSKVEKQLESHIKKANDLQIKLDKIKSGYSNMGTNRPIKETEHIEALAKQYEKVERAIDEVRSADSITFSSMVSNAERERVALENMVKEFRNAENVATSLRSKDIDTVKSTYASKLDTLILKMKDADVYTSGFESGAENLRSILSSSTDANGLVSFLNGLDKLEAGYKRAAQAAKSFESAETYSKRAQRLTDSIKNIQRISPEINEFEVEINGAKVSVQSLLTALSKVKTKGAFHSVNEDLKVFKTAAESAGIAIRETAKQAKSVSDIKFKIDDTGFSGFKQEVARAHAEADNLEYSYKDLESALRQLDVAMADVYSADKSGNVQRLIAANEEYENSLRKVNSQLKLYQQAEKQDYNNEILSQKRESLNSEMEIWLKENSRAAKNFGDEIRRLQASLGSLDDRGVRLVGQQFKNITRQAKAAGEVGLTTFDQLKAKIKEYSVYFGAAELFMYAEQALRDMFEQVKLIDSAMTELKKVTNETEAAYEKFLTNAASRAREIGTTIDGLVSSTADFARLGYGFEDAQGLAEVANIYAVVGDEIEGVEGATESLISTMAAFKDEMNGMSNTDFAMSIIDKFNEIKFYLSPYTVMYM